METGRIRRLDEAVVNRIAAGEVVQRPVNAVKELIENSLDAKCTFINITIKSGGMKMISIQDNGSGILKEDLSLLCERFATSKIANYNDLFSLSTYGFRGEALASISHVAHVSVISQTQGSVCAYMARYLDGSIVPWQPGLPPEPRPCAGNQGTHIVVDNLFYNDPVRLAAFKTPGEEYTKILDVVGKYAIHNSHVSFSLKKHKETSTDIKTAATNSSIDNVKLIYGSKVGSELIEVKSKSGPLRCELTGLVSNANTSSKRFLFILFINGRLVDCGPLRSIIDKVYENYLPKDHHPFAYLSLRIDPAHVDVNVHPTKHEVLFLHQDQVVTMVQDCVRASLLDSNRSRTFSTQLLLTTAMGFSSTPVPEVDTQKSPRVHPSQLVRSDTREQKLDAFFETVAQQNYSSVASPASCSPSLSSRSAVPGVKYVRELRLSSVTNLQKVVHARKEPALVSLLEDYKFVGCINPTLTLVQHQTRLFLLNTSIMSEELFYQLILSNFGGYGYLSLSIPVPILDLVLLELEVTEAASQVSELQRLDEAQEVVQLLTSRSDMLLDYFSLVVDSQGCLASLPNLLEGYTPDLCRLPRFLLRLASNVKWDCEQICLDGIARQVAWLFSTCELKPGVCPCTGSKVTGSMSQVAAESTFSPAGWKWVTEHVLFPAFRSHLVPPTEWLSNGAVFQVADLPDLYKVFERC